MGNTVPLETLGRQQETKRSKTMNRLVILSALVAAAFAAPAAKLPLQPYDKRSAGAEPEEYMADPRKRSAGAEPEDYMEFNDYRSAYGYPSYAAYDRRKRLAGAEPEDYMGDLRKRFHPGNEPEDYDDYRFTYGYDMTDFRKRSAGAEPEDYM